MEANKRSRGLWEENWNTQRDSWDSYPTMLRHNWSMWVVNKRVHSKLRDSHKSILNEHRTQHMSRSKTHMSSTSYLWSKNSSSMKPNQVKKSSFTNRSTEHESAIYKNFICFFFQILLFPETSWNNKSICKFMLFKWTSISGPNSSPTGNNRLRSWTWYSALPSLEQSFCNCSCFFFGKKKRTCVAWSRLSLYWGWSSHL